MNKTEQYNKILEEAKSEGFKAGYIQASMYHISKNTFYKVSFDYQDSSASGDYCASTCVVGYARTEEGANRLKKKEEDRQIKDLGRIKWPVDIEEEKFSE